MKQSGHPSAAAEGDLLAVKKSGVIPNLPAGTLQSLVDPSEGDSRLPEPTEKKKVPPKTSRRKSKPRPTKTSEKDKEKDKKDREDTKLPEGNTKDLPKDPEERRKSSSGNGRKSLSESDRKSPKHDPKVTDKDRDEPKVKPPPNLSDVDREKSEVEDDPESPEDDVSDSGPEFVPTEVDVHSTFIEPNSGSANFHQTSRQQLPINHSSSGQPIATQPLSTAGGPPLQWPYMPNPMPAVNPWTQAPQHQWGVSQQWPWGFCPPMFPWSSMPQSQQAAIHQGGVPSSPIISQPQSSSPVATIIVDLYYSI